MLLETFQPIPGVAYLKLSDETWNEMCYLKLKTFETWNFVAVSFKGKNSPVKGWRGLSKSLSQNVKRMNHPSTRIELSQLGQDWYNF